MIWVDKNTGEVHWSQSEYEGLIKKLEEMQREIDRLKQMING